jgi:hypothetical protein
VQRYRKPARYMRQLALLSSQQLRKAKGAPCLILALLRQLL